MTRASKRTHDNGSVPPLRIDVDHPDKVSQSTEFETSDNTSTDTTTNDLQPWYTLRSKYTKLNGGRLIFVAASVEINRKIMYRFRRKDFIAVRSIDKVGQAARGDCHGYIQGHILTMSCCFVVPCREEFHKGKSPIPETRTEEGSAKRNIARKHDHDPSR